MLSEFRKFIARGNVLDMAVGIIIGAAFGTVVKSLVEDILMPPIGLAMGGVDFSNLFIDLRGSGATSVAAAKEAGMPTINYGLFINNLISFLIISFAVFTIVKAFARMQREQKVSDAAAAPVEADCPHCLFKIPVGARRCGHCTQAV
jgi:large conductance mechanosensitive channel